MQIDACFHNPFYVSLVYMHPQCMIFNLNLMPSSQSKHSLYGMDGFFSHISIFHIPRGQEPRPFLFWSKLTWSLPLLTKLVFQITYWFTLAQNAPSSDCGGKYFHAFLTHLNLYVHSSYSLASITFSAWHHLHDMHTFEINLDHGIPFDH